MYSIRISSITATESDATVGLSPKPYMRLFTSLTTVSGLISDREKTYTIFDEYALQGSCILGSAAALAALLLRLGGRFGCGAWLLGLLSIRMRI
jgi:hypothetical protein